MAYQPILPFSGYTGWVFLNRTLENQKAAYVASESVQTNESYFREKIGSISTAEELVSDRRLLSVALGAFGLEDDIDNKYFIRKVLEEGTLDTDALANKLSDKRYLELSQAFGFGDYSTPRTVMSDFADTIIAQYEERSFEVAVGEQDQTMRLAMNAQRELADLAGSSSSDLVKWYKVIGSEPMAEVMQMALGLPDSVSSLDVDQQVTIYQDKLDSMFGDSSLNIFEDSAQIDKLVKYYLLKSQVSEISSYNPASVALTLLRG